jgi:hypothetical protein
MASSKQVKNELVLLKEIVWALRKLYLTISFLFAFLVMLEDTQHLKSAPMVSVIRQK